MERLTKWLNDKKNLCIKECEKECVEKYTECHKCEPFKDVMKRLAEYEDAEEQGLLQRFPVVVGSTVYIISREKIIPLKIDGIYINENLIAMQGVNEQYFGYGKVTLYDSKKIIEWFLTKEEAELELANRQQSHAEAIMYERNWR